MRVPGKISRFLEKWGHYLLAALCAAVILLSGLWTRALSTRDAEALHDTAQRLADVTVPPAAFIPLRPCAGAVLRPFSTAPLFFPAVGVWQIHPGGGFCGGGGRGYLRRGGRRRGGGRALSADRPRQRIRFRVPGASGDASAFRPGGPGGAGGGHGGGGGAV